ncbi:uncharacterized protein DS421_17g592700 [Arachis hypogaea]|nr:uncharacterized protein DS421_17g592700 [Arachis hypogaea]
MDQRKQGRKHTSGEKHKKSKKQSQPCTRTRTRRSRAHYRIDQGRARVPCAHAPMLAHDLINATRAWRFERVSEPIFGAKLLKERNKRMKD